MHKLGKYEILEKIGVGGFGVVFKGYDPFIKRPVALKTCSVEDTETRERFRREAEIAGNLQHRNIVTVFEFGFEDGVPFLVQEYLSGEDLDRKIKRNEFVPLAEKILWLVQVARGLEFAHSRGIVHRDIKPANIRILDDGTAKIMDFGIARVAQQTSQLTQAGMTLGTAAYLAPEQIRGQRADARTDIFSFGVLAYELLAYERPFRAAEISAIFFKILNETPPSLALRVPDLPMELDRIVARCLAKDPARRYAPTGELVRALEKLTQRRPATTSTTGVRAAPRTAEGPTAPLPARTSAGSRPSLDDLELRHADDGPRVHSRSMATTALGRPRRWPRRLAVALLLAAGLGTGGYFLDRAGRVELIRMPVRELQRSVSPEPTPTPAAATAAVPAFASPPGGTAGAPSAAASSGPASQAGAPNATSASAPSPPGPAAAGGAPATPAPAPPPPPDPAHLLVGPAWQPDMQVKVAGRRVRLDREQRLRLDPGTYTLSFSLATADYSFSAVKKVTLAAGETERVSIPIERPGRLTVQPQLDTPGGIVRVDGQVLGPAPIRGRWLAPGAHQVDVFPLASGGSGAAAVSRSVTLRSDVETVVTFDVLGAAETQVRDRPFPAGG
jgi:predicted Ser/Thr protein kinase